MGFCHLDFLMDSSIYIREIFSKLYNSKNIYTSKILNELLNWIVFPTYFSSQVYLQIQLLKKCN